MFGYVRPYKPELRVKEFEAFRAMYCGLCHTLRRNYGLLCANLISYDLCFLALLTAQVRACGVEVCRRRCIASPFRRKICMAENEALRLAADITIILSYWKLRDGASDERGLKRLLYRAALVYLRPKYKKAASKHPDFAKATEERLSLLSSLEAEGCDSLDRTADAFARLLAALSEEFEDAAARRALSELLYHVGRWIYILDAYDDIDEDVKNGAYNAVNARYGVTAENRAEVKRRIGETLALSAQTAAACAELLPQGAYTPIISNILYLGLAETAGAVMDGQHKQRRAGHGSI